MKALASALSGLAESMMARTADQRLGGPHVTMDELDAWIDGLATIAETVKLLPEAPRLVRFDGGAFSPEVLVGGDFVIYSCGGTEKDQPRTAISRGMAHVIVLGSPAEVATRLGFEVEGGCSMNDAKGEPIGCGVQADNIVFRGRTARLYLCGVCRPRYTGSGKVSRYEGRAESDESPKEPGTFYGPKQFCGAETAS